MDDDLAAQFAAMGVQPAPAQPAARPEHFEVMRANADSIAAWLAVETQWRIAAGMGGIVWLGLDYSAVDIALRRLKFDDPDAVFGDLQIMEAEALSVLWSKGE